MDRQSLIGLFDELRKIAMARVVFSGAIKAAKGALKGGLPAPASLPKGARLGLSNVTAARMKLPSPASLVRGNVIQGRVAPAPSVRMAA